MRAKCPLGIRGIYPPFSHHTELVKHARKERVVAKQVSQTNWRGKSQEWRTG